MGFVFYFFLQIGKRYLFASMSGISTVASAESEDQIQAAQGKGLLLSTLSTSAPLKLLRDLLVQPLKFSQASLYL